MFQTFRGQWEQFFFGIVGFAFLAFSFYSLFEQDVAAASAAFAMAFFSFIFSNIARFKRFKGLGFEAELWEDKQKEAEQLIDRLKSVVSVYTREVVMQKVMQGRLGDGANWQEYWKLYEELVSKHNELGQAIDFSELKAKMDKVFLFDMVSNLYRPIADVVSDCRTNAQSKVKIEFGSPVTDVEGYNQRHAQLQEIPDRIKNLFAVEGDLAREVLDWVASVQSKLSEHFDIDVELPDQSIEKLEMLSRLYQEGPIPVTDELIELSKYTRL